MCKEGQCVPGTAMTCDDGNPCTDDSCDPKAGCVYKNNEAPCEDGNPCTASDQCHDGKCMPGGPTDCDDKNPCTDDTCDATVGCVHKDNANPCDDNNLCTSDDVCVGGKCTGKSVVCDDHNICTDDSCDPKVGCVFNNNSNPCPDKDLCTVNSRCKEGECVGEPRNCEDGNTCTQNYCAPAIGCGIPSYAEEGTPCTDASNKCLAEGKCNASGQCILVKQINCDDGVKCTKDQCNPNVGCQHPYKNYCNCEKNDANCNDGNPNTPDCCRWLWDGFNSGWRCTHDCN